MKWFANLSTPGKLLLAFGSMLLILGAVIVVSYQSISNITGSFKSVHDQQFTIAIKLHELRAQQNYIRGQVLEMILTLDKVNQQKIEKTIDERSSLVEGIITNLSKLNLDSKSLSQLNELKSHLTAYRQIRDQQIALIYEGKREEAEQIALQTQDDNFEKIRSISAEMGARAEDEVDVVIAQNQLDAAKAIQLCLILGGVAFVFGLGMMFLLHLTMASPLLEISAIAARIADCDLTTTVAATDRADEMGAMTQSFKRMTDTLSNQIREITDGVNVLASSSNEILVSTSQLASGAVESATGISETMTTVEEVRQAARLSSEKAKSVADSAQRVVQVSQTGKKAVEDTVATMLHIRDQMEAIAQTILQLSEQSQAIGGIIASVTDLADQSNLLAVNAAIEAAKAGEQGRGFVVVAQEIKSLAEQSKQATTQIRAILTNVQKTTNVAVLATEQGTKAVDGGVKQSSQTGEAVKVLAESSMEASQVASQIVASSQQQVVGMDQIGVAMTNINQAGAQNASAMKQAEIAAKNLNELGQKLRKIVDQFKIKGA
jgi:methyl-accepting chemotaxis protein